MATGLIHSTRKDLLSPMNDPVAVPVEGQPNLLLGAYDLDSVGYTAAEFFFSGTASSYAPIGEVGPDGQWDALASDAADYTTRMVVVTPTDQSAFNGSVVVEWNNVSGGIDMPAVWQMAHREMIREGYAFVAVSAQHAGVEGGSLLAPAGDHSLKTLDLSRYGDLHHPGDAFAFDIFSQAGQLIRAGDHNGVLRGLHPEVVLAVGESQSAMFLTTYVNAVDPLAAVYDGFVVHSRFGPAAPLDGRAMLDPANEGWPGAVAFRPDLRVPVITVITETDLLGTSEFRAGYLLARRPDSELLRAWEVPGASHADNYTIRVGWIDTGIAPLDQLVAAYSPTNALMGQQLSYFINFGPQHHYVLQAALASLHRWARTGEPAPHAPIMETTDADQAKLVLDANGVATGGVRTPWVDVPIASTSGFADSDLAIAALFGSGQPFDAETIAALYPGGAADYLERFAAALDAAIRSGFIVPADRAEILDIAAATYPGQGQG